MMARPTIKFRTGFRPPPAVVSARASKPAPAPVREVINQTEQNRSKIEADPSIVLLTADDVAFTLSHRFAIYDPEFKPRPEDFDEREIDVEQPAARPSCIPLAAWAFVWPPMRTNALVQRTAELFFYGQPPMAAFYHACVEFLADEMACDKRRPRATPEQVADKRAADVQLTRQLVLDGLKRAAASPDVDDPEHDRDRAGEARILAYKLPPYGVPAYWERGDQYPRVDEVDVSAAPVRAERLPSPIKKLILSRVRI